MKVIKKKLSELRRPKKNVRNHSIKQIEEFKRSVQMFGQIRPIVIDEDNVILAGNGLFMALEALGLHRSRLLRCGRAHRGREEKADACR